MNENIKIATRQSYGEELAKLGEKNKQIVVLDADLSTATKTELFAKKFPDRFINVGIAEQNLMGIAAGLSTFGKIPYASTFAVFAAGRAYEQIRNSIAYPKLNVKICATHAGITVGEDGATHQMLEDLGLMRSLPNMTVMCTSDDIQTKWAVREISKINGPVYLRLCRLATPVIYDTSSKFEIGKAVQMGEGTDAAILATGVTVSEAIKAKEILKEKGIEKISTTDLSRDDMAEAVEDAFKYDKMILAAPSYNAGVFPPMQEFLYHLQSKNYQNRKIGIIENGSWAPSAAKTMKEIISKMKNIEIYEPTVTIISKMNENNIAELEKLANNLMEGG